ncbi:MAG: N-6 DNA methylase [Verrucomicrobia bacterium]|nr:N-6 DNA methylase [Verrucomicrobiota bacterium]
MHSADSITFWQTGHPTPALAESGLRAVGEWNLSPDLSAEVRVVLKKAGDFGASHVFFRSRPGRPTVPEALVFDDASGSRTRTEDAFAQLHRRLWSWGAVPMVYRRLPGRVDVFRCAHRADFDTGRAKPKYSFYNSLDTAADITGHLEAEPWWDMRRLANGTLWDDRNVAKQFLSEDAAHKTLLRNVEALDKRLAAESRLASNLRRRLLVISLLVAYLEDREVFKLEAGFFARYKPGAQKFFDVLGDAEALIKLLGHLETERFNGNVFTLEEEEKQQLRQTRHLRKFAQLIEGNTEPGGQQTLWRLYSFHDLPVELISHIYQLFVEDRTTCVYTPPFLARLMLEEALTPERMDRLEQRDEVVFDPSCGSGIFLVEAFKRLVLHWRASHAWKQPPVDVLRKLILRVRGTDVDGYAVELAAFSLCLAMCDELTTETIINARKLFPSLKGKTLVNECFFQQARERKLPRNIGVIMGNPPFGSASGTGTTAQAYEEYLAVHGGKSLPDKQSAYLFLHHGMEALVEDGLLCLLQKDNFLYNRRSIAFRRAVFERWDVREILDFTPIRGLFIKDPKVVVVMAEAHAPNPARPILHAIFRRTAHTQAELSFELDYYDMQWVPRQMALAKDFVWRCNLFGGGRTVSLVERLKQLPTLKKFVKDQGWDYGEGFMVGTPETDEVVEYLYQQPVIPAKAILADGTIDETLIETQETRCFQWPRPTSRYQKPVILIRQTDSLQMAYWNKHDITYDSEVLGIACAGNSGKNHRDFFDHLFRSHRFFSGWLALTGGKAGLQKATALNKSDIDDFPFPADEADLDLSTNDEIILSDACDFYRDFQRLGDDAEMMRQAKPGDYREFARVFARQINAVHKKLRPLPVRSWFGVACQPFVFGKAEPDWQDTDGLSEKLAKLLRARNSPTLTTVRILRVFDGPFVFLIKPARLRYWLRSVALRDADEALADLRTLGF